ncbi:8543_t:CDS:2, partial [Scutellospora calospora]
MEEDNNFRVELLECAKLLNLPNEDYFYVPKNEKESILLVVPDSKIPIRHQLLEKWSLNDLDANIFFTEVLNDLNIQDLDLCCDIYEDVATRESYFMEEPLLPIHILKDNEFKLYTIPTLKQLSNQLPTTDISPEPFIKSEIQQFTLDDL